MKIMGVVNRGQFGTRLCGATHRMSCEDNGAVNRGRFGTRLCGATHSLSVRKDRV